VEKKVGSAKRGDVLPLPARISVDPNCVQKRGTVVLN